VSETSSILCCARRSVPLHPQALPGEAEDQKDQKMDTGCQQYEILEEGRHSHSDVATGIRRYFTAQEVDPLQFLRGNSAAFGQPAGRDAGLPFASSATSHTTVVPDDLEPWLRLEVVGTKGVGCR
jgi:hypothetical protein